MTTKILKLSEKLGWGDMLTQVAIPALIEIIRVADDYNVDCLSDNLSSDTVFSLLAGPDVYGNELSQFVSLRGEIEECMRHGYSYVESINEWWK